MRRAAGPSPTVRLKSSFEKSTDSNNNWTLPTHGSLFAALLLGTIMLVTALTFFPSPIARAESPSTIRCILGRRFGEIAPEQLGPRTISLSRVRYFGLSVAVFP